MVVGDVVFECTFSGNGVVSLVSQVGEFLSPSGNSIIFNVSFVSFLVEDLLSKFD